MPNIKIEGKQSGVPNCAGVSINGGDKVGGRFYKEIEFWFLRLFSPTIFQSLFNSDPLKGVSLVSHGSMALGGDDCSYSYYSETSEVHSFDFTIVGILCIRSCVRKCGSSAGNQSDHPSPIDTSEAPVASAMNINFRRDRSGCCSKMRHKLFNCWISINKETILDVKRIRLLARTSEILVLSFEPSSCC